MKVQDQVSDIFFFFLFALGSTCISNRGLELPHELKDSLVVGLSVAMATMVCCGNASAVVTQQKSHLCVLKSSSSSRISLLPSCTRSGLRITKRGDAMVVRMGIRAVESFDATFQLTPEVIKAAFRCWLLSLAIQSCTVSQSAGCQ